jgi:hypothetical protein
MCWDDPWLLRLFRQMNHQVHRHSRVLWLSASRNIILCDNIFVEAACGPGASSREFLCLLR